MKKNWKKILVFFLSVFMIAVTNIQTFATERYLG